jgi:hypothetical protein
MASKFVIQYHVGIRHYTATDAISLTGFSSKSQLAELGQWHLAANAAFLFWRLWPWV